MELLDALNSRSVHGRYYFLIHFEVIMKFMLRNKKRYVFEPKNIADPNIYVEIRIYGLDKVVDLNKYFKICNEQSCSICSMH